MKKKGHKNSILTSPNINKYDDFVAIDTKSNRICICGNVDTFFATKIGEHWKAEYPDCEDLLNNFSEIKNMEEVERYSQEARSSIRMLSN